MEFETIELWHIALLACFLGVVNTINQTARQSLINSLVPKEELLNAIGLQSSVNNFSKIIGPSAGGVIIAYLGISGCFLVNAHQFCLFALQFVSDGPAAMGSAAKAIRAYWPISKKDMATCVTTGVFFILSEFPTSWPCLARRTVDSCRFSRRMCCMLARRVWLADVRAGNRRYGSILVSRVREQAARRHALDLFLCAGFCVVPDPVRFLIRSCCRSYLLTMVGFCQLGERALANTVIQTGHAAESARSSVEPVFHGPRFVVPWRFDYGRLGVGHRHRLDLRGLRRCLRHRRDRFVDLQSQAARRSSSTLN